MTKYLLTLSLKKHPKEHKFQYIGKMLKGEDEQGMKERICMEFEQKFGTPIKCTKIERIEEPE